MNHIEEDGVDVFYRINGIEDRPAIIFIHGLAGDSRFFHNQLRYFGNSYKAIAIDLPGHGRSPYIPAQTVEIYNKSIESVLKKENIDSYILAGHSMGGVICIENYLRHKDKIQAMVLVSTSSTIPVSKTLIDASINDFDKFFNKMLPRIFHKKAGIFILAAQKNITKEQKKIITGDLKLCSEINYTEQLSEIAVPVLLIANKFDRMIPSYMTEDMKWKIRDSKFVVFNDEGHVPFFENSTEFNGEVEKFIQSVR